MNRIFLKNLMMMLFWLYTGIVVAVPVEEVHKFVEKSSADRQAELVRRQRQLISEREGLQKIERHNQDSAKESKAEGPRVEVSKAGKPGIDPFEEHVQRKEKDLKELAKQHNQKELVEFLKSDEYKTVSKVMKTIGFDTIFDKIAKVKDVTKEDFSKMINGLPDTYEAMEKKLQVNNITEDQKRVFLKLYNKAVEVLKFNLPEKHSLDDIESAFKFATQSPEKIYADVIENVKTEKIKKSIDPSTIYAILTLVSFITMFVGSVLAGTDSTLLEKIGVGMMVGGLLLSTVFSAAGLSDRNQQQQRR